jgi:DNA/RNA endonuclease YhcR with UshA esterase domain
MKKIYVLILSAVLFCSLGFNVTVHAATAGLQINEVYYDTVGTDSKEEWIELYNPTDLDINLSGYKLKSNELSPFVIMAGIIKAKSYFVIAKDKTGFHTLYDFDPSIDGMTINLSNDGDYVALLDPTGTEIDSIAWGSSTYPGIVSSKGVKTGHSLERKNLGIDTDDCSLDFVDIPIPAPFAKYEKPVYSDAVELSEIMPYPADVSHEEFIEIHNKTDKAFDLSGWQLDDAEGGSSSYTITSDIVIAPDGYLTFYHSLTGIFLNNDTDSARLFDPNGDLRSTVTYSKGQKDDSYALINGAWLWTAQSTPGEENQFKDTAVIKAVTTKSNAAATTSALSENTVVSGKVTAWPGVLSDQVFYLQADSKGYEIYNYHGDFPEIKEGDLVEVSGMPSTAGRIKTETSGDVVLKSANQSDLPKIVGIGEVGEANLDQYVEVKGIISKTSGDTFYLQDPDSAAQIKIIIREATGIDKPPMAAGDDFTVAGIVSVYKNEYRILPFKLEDVTISSSDYLAAGYLPVAGGNEKVILIISSLFFIIWNSFLIQKKKQKNSLAALPRW